MEAGGFGDAVGGWVGLSLLDYFFLRPLKMSGRELKRGKVGFFFPGW